MGWFGPTRTSGEGESILEKRSGRLGSLISSSVSLFRKFGDNSDWRNDTTAQRTLTPLLPPIKGERLLEWFDPREPAERANRFWKSVAVALGV
ncbi:hypothetical protein AB4124_32185 [Paenibacillus sp. 2KB_20]|uniref:hypothetical protein n=1 Tax=Paenibacillus sp. 2KB_20 TaxID=3232977 RepID=UPI003F980A57